MNCYVARLIVAPLTDENAYRRANNRPVSTVTVLGWGNSEQTAYRDAVHQGSALLGVTDHEPQFEVLCYAIEKHS